MSAEMTFPVLKPAEIVSCSAELSVPVTVEDITNPQPEVIKRVLEVYLELFLQLAPDDIKQQPTFEAMMIDSPELHEDSIPFLVRHAATDMMMRACGITDYSLRDVISPESKRVRKMLSALINFAKFREMQMVSIEQYMEERDHLSAEVASVEAELAAVSKKVDDLNAKREAEAPTVAAIETECGEMMERINELNCVQAALQHKLRELKDEFTEVSDKASKKSFEVQSVRQQCDQFQSQIVRSPQRIKTEIVRMGGMVTEEHREVAAAEARGRELGARVEAVGDSQQDLRRCRRVLDEVGEEYVRLDKAKAAATELQDRAAAERKQLKETAAERQLLQRQVETAQTRVQRLEATHETKREAGLQSIEETRRERERLAAEKAKAAAAAKENAEFLADVKGKISDVKAEHAAEVSALQKDASTLLKQIQNYHGELETVMNMPVHV